VDRSFIREIISSLYTSVARFSGRKMIMAFWRRNFGASGGVWRRLVAIERRIEWLRVFQIGYYGSFLSRDDRLGSVE
jgi:hypothetical protein